MPTDKPAPTPLERLREMKHFLNEYQHAVGSRSLQNLPDPSQLQARDVRIPKDVVVRFRNDYLLLLGFAAHYCGVDPEKLCGMDLMGPFFEAVRALEEATR